LKCSCPTVLFKKDSLSSEQESHPCLIDYWLSPIHFHSRPLNFVSISCLLAPIIAHLLVLTSSAEGSRKTENDHLSIVSTEWVSVHAIGVSSQQKSGFKVVSQRVATSTVSRGSTVIYHQKNCISTMYLSIPTNKNHEKDTKFSIYWKRHTGFAIRSKCLWCNLLPRMLKLNGYKETIVCLLSCVTVAEGLLQ
jgi:hypothetical protein